MTHAFATTQKTFRLPSGKSATLFSLPALARKFPNVKRLPVSLRIVLESVLRNCDGKRVTAEHVAQLANWSPNAAAQRRDPVPGVACRAAGLHRRSAAGRSGRDAQRGGAPGQGPQAHRTAGAGRPGGRPFGDGRPLRQEERARPEHEARVPAQPRTLRVHEVGHAGVRHLPCRAARVRHRAPGQPGVPGARRAPLRRRRRLPGLRWSEPTATRR